MSEKKVLYLLCAVLILASCRTAPKTDFRILRFIDLLEQKNIVSSPFMSGALDPGQSVSFHEKSRPILDRGSGSNPLGIKRKINHQGLEENSLVAPPGSTFIFDVQLPAGGTLEFGAGIVRGAHSEEIRKRLGSAEGPVLFRVRLEMSGRNKSIYQESIDSPPWNGKGVSRIIPARVALPISGGKGRISFITKGPEGIFSFWANPVVYSSGKTSRKIILISIDTLRADHVGSYGYAKNTSPNMDALAADGALFSNVYASSPWTLPSHVSLLTSLSCLRHGVNRESDRMDGSQATLADVLKTEGFFCAAVTGGGFVSPIFGFSKGFELYGEGEGSLWNSTSAGSVFNSAGRWIDRNKDKDFFLFIHTYQPHNPYLAPPPYDTVFLDRDRLWTMIDVGSHLGGRWGIFKGVAERERRNIVGLYDGEIRYTDEALIGPLVAKLKSLKIYDEALIILTSDHGEEFYDHGGWEHGRSLYEEILKVPLVIKFPGSRFRGKKVRSRVRLLDVMPTVLDVFRIKDQGVNLEGRSLLPVLRGSEKEDRDVVAYLAGGVLDFPVPEKTAILDGPYKVILNKPYDGALLDAFLFPPPRLDEVEVYDLAADPEERTNIISSKSELARRLVTMMKELREKSRKDDGEKVELESDVEEKLRALGYIR